MKILTNKNILVISPEAWGVSMLSKHHYVIELTKTGNKIWFLQPRNSLNKKPINSPYNVTLLNDYYTIPGLRYLPAFLRKMVFRNRIRKMEEDNQIKFDIIWNFDNSRFFDLDCFNNAIKIHHRMDFHYDYQNRRASKSADVCFGVTKDIVESMKAHNPNSYFIQHGYAELQKSNYQLPNTTNKKAIYVGNLLIPFINWAWMHALIASQPEVQFYFVGPYSKGNLNMEINQQQLQEVEKISNNANVVLLGERSPAEVRSILDQADIIFAAYDAEKYPKIIANSHKILEYLGSGKPIICNKMSEYENYHELIYMADSQTEFLNLFNWVCQNPEKSNDKNLTTRRIQYAMENSYTNQIKRIDDILYELKK